MLFAEAFESFEIEDYIKFDFILVEFADSLYLFYFLKRSFF